MWKKSRGLNIFRRHCMCPATLANDDGGTKNSQRLSLVRTFLSSVTYGLLIPMLKRKTHRLRDGDATRMRKHSVSLAYHTYHFSGAFINTITMVYRCQSNISLCLITLLRSQQTGQFSCPQSEKNRGRKKHKPQVQSDRNY